MRFFIQEAVQTLSIVHNIYNLTYLIVDCDILNIFNLGSIVAKCHKADFIIICIFPLRNYNLNERVLSNWI